MNHITAIKEALAAECPQLELRENEAMQRHTSFRIGGPVPLMALPKSAEEAAAAFTAAFRAGVQPLCFGNGSNLLVADEGLSTFAIKCAMDALRLLAPDTVYAGSGVSMASFAIFAMEQGLGGMEFAHGIPGSIGGALSMNAGAYDGEMAQIVQWVDYVDREGKTGRLAGEALGFGYRHSVFSGDEDKLILGAAFHLTPMDKEVIKAKLKDLMARRKEKQPLEFPSAGSTFKRPPGHFAGALIESCGLKGKRVGGAQVSEKHAGFVINTGGATCADVVALMRLVREKVAQEYDILLEPEVKLIGCTL